ncbi:MAG: hypothetical protein KKH28_14720 [Elusimicrobia bacterium]|nr:hypothetical protein [Elusimicrobiota bacterium]
MSTIPIAGKRKSPVPAAEEPIGPDTAITQGRLIGIEPLIRHSHSRQDFDQGMCESMYSKEAGMSKKLMIAMTGLLLCSTALVHARVQNGTKGDKKEAVGQNKTESDTGKGGKVSKKGKEERRHQKRGGKAAGGQKNKKTDLAKDNKNNNKASPDSKGAPGVGKDKDGRGCDCGVRDHGKGLGRGKGKGSEHGKKDGGVTPEDDSNANPDKDKGLDKKDGRGETGLDRADQAAGEHGKQGRDIAREKTESNNGAGVKNRNKEDSSDRSGNNKGRSHRRGAGRGGPKK